MKKVFFLFFFALISFTFGQAFAAWVDPTLEDALDNADDKEMVGSYVVLADRVDLRDLQDRLDTMKASRSKRHFEVITTLQDKAAQTQEPLRLFLENYQKLGAVQSYRAYWIDNAFAVRATADFYQLLRQRPEIDRIYFDYPIESIAPVRIADGDEKGPKGIEPGIESTRAPELWDLGIDGTGVIAGDMDTGCDGTHPAFATRWRGLSAPASQCWYDPWQHADFPYDSGEHGTHTMGTMVGGDDGDNQIGMAPGAQWIAAAVVDVPTVNIYTEAVAAFEWFADPDNNPGTMDDVPAVVNNSWGISGFPYCDDTFWASMDVAEMAGVVVTFAAGNEGPFRGTLRSPADRITTDYNAFAIGALAPSGDRIASFSSRGPSRCDRATIKPEVSAIGQAVRSSIPGGYTEMDGTSMATPHVSGAILLLSQAYPDATVQQLKMALYFTAVDLGEAGEDNTFGRGRIDVVAAYEFLANACDNDGDGYEKPECGGNDCNDYDAAIHPGQTESCNGIDDNCDEVIPADETDPDEDGYMACEGDCGPDDPKTYPGASEICDGVDNNCDGTVPANETDPDSDGVLQCEGDCRPNDPNVYPGADEVCDDIDNNCDAQLLDGEVDADGDGYFLCSGDCNDDSAAIHPGAVEICDDFVDNNCDGLKDAADPTCQGADDDSADDDTADDDQTDDDNDGDDDNDDESSAACGC